MKKTHLYKCHKDLKGKMIDFFGWEMPLEFSGIITEHMAVRCEAGLFDVSHMGEILVAGRQALDFVQYLTPNDVARLTPNKAHYTALTTPQGTFVDDLLVYCLEPEKYLLVVNASNTDKDYEWIVQHKEGFDVTVENQSDQYTQMALQGPKALEVMKNLTKFPFEELGSFQFGRGEVAGEECLISRTGYTGEDGVEIYTLSPSPEKIWEAVLEKGKGHGVMPIGLGARDTLRLEAKLMLYGNDIDETTTVLEAGLSWLIKFKKGDFLGRDALLRQKEDGIKKKLIGFEIEGRGIARPHYPVFIGNNEVAKVNSGTFAPYLKKSIGLTYLPIDHTEIGMEFEVGVRDKRIKAKVVPTPFYKRESQK
ncbi:MAG: glycine cleavage system aminomethyltransferase GcvT [Candidatus Aminicenantes bacterium]|nr:glycine cleavage system aminomethyltransferase GcvT [Candidatus Aminicenantes bacterium]